MKDATARWKQVLHLGEQLLTAGRAALPEQGGTSNQGNAPAYYADFAVVLAQRDLILAAVNQVVGGQPSLWLSEEMFLRPKAGWHRDIQPQNESLFAPEPPTVLMQQAFQSHQVRCAASPDAEGIPLAENLATDGPACRAVAAPFLARDRETHALAVLGVLQIERPHGRPFNGEQLELIEGLAAQVAIALQAERRMEIGRWRVQQLSLVRKVGSQIANVRDLDELSRRVTRLILETFDYYYVAIFTLEPGQDSLISAPAPGLDENRQMSR